MKFLKLFIKVLKSYDYADKLISVFAFVAILAMIVKMMLFPYGFFHFGEPNIYTEGVVSRNGIQNINPLFVDYNDADREISALVFSGLMKYDPDKKAIVDDMATLSVNAEKTEYTLTLREGLKWHDGQPMTMDDVYFTFHEIVMNPSFRNGILKINFDGVRIEQEDERVIKFILEKPNVFFITNLTVGILPKHILEGVDPYDLFQHSFNKAPIGTGPYMVKDPVKSFPNGRMQVILTRSPYYYGEPSEIEYMRLVTFPTMDYLMNEVNAVNGVVKVSGKYILEFKNNDRFDLIPYELPQYTAVFMNMESALLKNKNVRLAMSKLIDKNTFLNESVDKIRVDTPLMSLSQAEWEYSADKDKAIEILEEAGFTYGVDDVDHLGIRYGKDERALEFDLIARYYEEGTYQFEETKKAIDFLEHSWESAGFGIKVELLSLEDFNRRIMSRDYDLLFVGHNLGYNLDTYSYWHSTQAGPAGQNFSNYKSFQADTLIENIRSTFDESEKTAKLKELAEQIRKDVPAIFLYRPKYFYAIDGKIEGLSMENVVFPSDRYDRLGIWKFD
ncbi:MAG: ABC transporter substrate-binding protein [Candidatus Gracilibacteria bacterium]|nr:ABC transporter substrate-binding protein [Candidatus Gracilibacteria bacterium]